MEERLAGGTLAASQLMTPGDASHGEFSLELTQPGNMARVPFSGLAFWPLGKSGGIIDHVDSF